MAAHDFEPTGLYAIEGSYLLALRRVMHRLYTERRMDGDEMRDAGHTIDAALDYAAVMGKLP